MYLSLCVPLGVDPRPGSRTPWPFSLELSVADTWEANQVGEREIMPEKNSSDFCWGALISQAPLNYQLISIGHHTSFNRKVRNAIWPLFLTLSVYQHFPNIDYIMRKVIKKLNVIETLRPVWNVYVGTLLFISTFLEVLNFIKNSPAFLRIDSWENT